MANRVAAFNQADVVRAVRAAHKAGLPIARVEIEPGGKIVVVVGDPVAAAPSRPINEWDEVLVEGAVQ